MEAQGQSPRVRISNSQSVDRRTTHMPHTHAPVTTTGWFMQQFVKFAFPLFHKISTDYFARVMLTVWLTARLAQRARERPSGLAGLPPAQLCMGWVPWFLLVLRDPNALCRRRFLTQMWCWWRRTPRYTVPSGVQCSTPELSYLEPILMPDI